MRRSSTTSFPPRTLPLLQPIRGIPLIGNPIADLIQPVPKVIVDLGYADWAHGFGSEADQPDANVLVPFGVFPDVNPLEVIEKLVAGVQQGISDFIADFGPNGSIAKEIAAISLPTLSFALPTPDGLIEAVQHFVLKSAEWVSGAAGAIYEALLPTADVINSIVTVLPAYNVDLFLEGVKQMLGGDLIGGLVNAIGLPLAADVGLITTAGLVAALAWLEAAQDIVELTKNIFESA
ncbi:MAG: PE-PPE domain-containing protein [Mycolicibacterium sp.]|nr:PE-PPE domain-containing protein [Mycolicibacterium sp.]